MGKLIFVFIFLFSSIMVYSAESINLDNQDLQEYKGKKGLWTMVQSSADLNNLVKKYNITLKEAKEINDNNISFGDYNFIPYSDDYIKELESSGKKRENMASSDNEFIWPIGNASTISSTFGFRNRKMHTGVDLPAQRGTAIIAVMDGRVISNHYEGGHGKTIYLEHRNNFYSRYSHNSVNLVKKGDFVKKGQIIGYVGSSGNSTGNHLHFEIRYKDVPLNPLDFLPFKEEFKESHLFKNWK